MKYKLQTLGVYAALILFPIALIYCGKVGF